MPYCPHCGNETEALIALASPVTETVNAEVEIARIQAERDIKVAEIGARTEKNWNETRVEVAEIETTAEVAGALLEGEIIAATLEGGDDEAEAEGEPIAVELPEAEPEPEPEPDMEPPVVEVSTPKKSGGGYWANYR